METLRGPDRVDGRPGGGSQGWAERVRPGHHSAGVAISCQPSRSGLHNSVTSQHGNLLPLRDAGPPGPGQAGAADRFNYMIFHAITCNYMMNHYMALHAITCM